MGYQTDEISAIRWVSCINVGSGQIPGASPVQVVGIVLTDNHAVYQVAQIGSGSYSAFNLCIAFNGPLAINAGAYGVCQTCDGNVQTLWDTGTPSPGDVWGIKPGQFSLTKNGVGKFVVHGIVDSGTKRMFGLWEGIETLICTLTGSVSARSGTTPGYGTGTIQTCAGGVFTATAWTLTLYNSVASLVAQYLADGSSVKYVQAKYINGLPFIDVDDCN